MGKECRLRLRRGVKMCVGRLVHGRLLHSGLGRLVESPQITALLGLAYGLVAGEGIGTRKVTAYGIIGRYSGKDVHNKMGGSRVMLYKTPELDLHAYVGHIADRG